MILLSWIGWKTLPQRAVLFPLAGHWSRVTLGGRIDGMHTSPLDKWKMGSCWFFFFPVLFSVVFLAVLGLCACAWLSLVTRARSTVVAAHGLLRAVGSFDAGTGSRAHGLQLTGSGAWAQPLRHTGLICPAPCGIFLDPGIEPMSPHWQVDSLPLDHQENPACWFYHYFLLKKVFQPITWTWVRMSCTLKWLQHKRIFKTVIRDCFTGYRYSSWKHLVVGMFCYPSNFTDENSKAQRASWWGQVRAGNGSWRDRKESKLETVIPNKSSFCLEILSQAFKNHWALS